MAAEKCLLVILGKKIEFVMVKSVPLAGIKVNGEYFEPIEFGSEDYFFDWLIAKNGSAVGISFFNKHVLPVIGVLPKYDNLEADANSEWTNIFFSQKTEVDNAQSCSQQNLNTLLLKSDRNRFALTFPVYDYDLLPIAKQSINDLFPAMTEAE